MNLELKPAISDKERTEIDEFLAQSAQSHVWQHPNAAPIYAYNGRAVQHLVGEDGGKIVCHGIIYVDRWKREAFCLRGPVFEHEETAGEAMRFLCREFENRGVGQLRISPYWMGAGAQVMTGMLSDLGFQPYYPKKGRYMKSGRVWLGGDLDEVFSRFGKETRKEVRRCARAGFEISQVVDYERAREGYRLIRALKRRKGLSPMPGAEFEELFAGILSQAKYGAVFNAYVDGGLAGTRWVVKVNKDVAIGVGYAIDNEFMRSSFRSFSVGVPLWWEGMKWAKGQGCEWFDVEGYDENTGPASALYHVHQFKRQFRPQPVQIVGEHIKICHPGRYRFYQAGKLWKKLLSANRAFISGRLKIRR